MILFASIIKELGSLGGIPKRYKGYEPTRMELQKEFDELRRENYDDSTDNISQSTIGKIRKKLEDKYDIQIVLNDMGEIMNFA